MVSIYASEARVCRAACDLEQVASFYMVSSSLKSYSMGDQVDNFDSNPSIHRLLRSYRNICPVIQLSDWIYALHM